MSGIRQHTIPQSLLRGFEAQRSGKYPQAYVFRRGREPHLSPTKDIAVQRHFYSREDPARETLDDQITRYETRLAQLLGNIRQLGDGASVDPEAAAEVVVHLTVRSAFLREFFAEAFGEMATSFGQLMSTPEAARSIFQLDSASVNSMLSKEIEREFEAVGGDAPKDLFRKVLSFAIRENFDSFHAAQMPEVVQVLGQLVDRSLDFAKSGHAKALAGALVPEGRSKHLEKFEWRIKSYSDKSLVLPDCVAISFVRDGTARAYVVSDTDEIDQIFLPISGDKLLVGIRGGDAACVVDDFNSTAARCSGEFFVAPRCSADLISLAEFIGSNADRGVTSLIGSALADISRKGEHQEKDAGKPSRDAAPFTVPEYSVRFPDCPEDDRTQGIRSVLDAIVNQIGTRVSLHGLDEVIFAVDYQAAYLSLDRGIELDPATLGTVVGHAMTQPVLRAGKVKFVALFRLEIGDALVAHDPLPRSVGFYFATSMLLRVVHFNRFDSKFPNHLLKPYKDVWAGQLLDMANNALCWYMTSRWASVLCPEICIEYRKSAINALAETKEQILRARQMLCEKGDVDAFFRSALPCISHLLVQLSIMMGSRDGLGQESDEKEGELADALRSCGLERWFGVVRRDLAAMFERDEAWTTYELVALSTHVERILWQFGVFGWKKDSGQMWFNWPFDWGRCRSRLSISAFLRFRSRSKRQLKRMNWRANEAFPTIVVMIVISEAWLRLRRTLLMRDKTANQPSADLTWPTIQRTTISPFYVRIAL